MFVLEKFISKLQLTLVNFPQKQFQKFLCGGRLIFGPDAGSLFLSTVLIAGPLVGLCCQCITKMNSSSPDHNQQVLGLPVLIATVILGLAVRVTIKIQPTIFPWVAAGC